MSSFRSSNVTKWGFAIYRTTYSPESDAKWDTFMSLVRQRALDAAAIEDPDIYTPGELSLPVVSDRETLNNASVGTVRGHFLKWTQDLRTREGADEWPNPRYEVCVMVDDEVLAAVVDDAPRPPDDDLDGESWVYLINATGDEPVESSDEAFPEDDEGWMKVALPVLLPRCFHLLKSPFAWEDMVYLPPPEVAFP